MYSRKISAAVFTIGSLFAGWHANSFAVDAASLEFATGNKSKIARVGVQWDWANQWFSSNDTQLGGYWDLTGAQIRQNRYQDIPGNEKDIYDLGITPVFRFQGTDKLGFYAEAGIGAHVFSSLYDNNHRRFSTAFEFGDHIGVGYVFSNKLELGLKVQHFSNGGIKHPNSGANFAVAKVAYHF
jgi:lipid A 3-O-deacylase